MGDIRPERKVNNNDFKDQFKPRTYSQNLKPTERKVIVALTQKKVHTYYTLSESTLAGSRVSILKALHGLESYGLISSEQESTGRRRIFYHLELRGLMVALTLEEFWEDPDNMENAAKIHGEKLPILLGKMNLYKKTWLSSLILKNLRSYIPITLMESEFHEFDTTSNEYDEEEFNKRYEESLRGLPEEIIHQVKQYPNTKGSLSTSYRDNASRLTDHVLGLVGLLDMKEKFVPTTLKMLLIYQSDEEIAHHIEKFFEAVEGEYRIKLERLAWWMETWEKLRHHHSVF